MVQCTAFVVGGAGVMWQRVSSAARVLPAAAALAAAVAPTLTFAQARDERGQPEPAPRRVREIPGITGATGPAAPAEPQRVLPLYPGEARLIDAPWPVARVSVANPEIADVDVINPQQVQ